MAASSTDLPPSSDPMWQAFDDTPKAAEQAYKYAANHGALNEAEDAKSQQIFYSNASKKIYLYLFSIAEGTVRDRQIFALKGLLRDAVAAKFGFDGYAMFFLEHFIKGTGETLVIDLCDLLNEDFGVRISFRNDAKTVLQTEGNTSPPVIHFHTVDQSHYRNPDWHGALGTFQIIYKRILSSPPDNVRLLWVHGNKGRRDSKDKNVGMYTWHPNDPRVRPSRIAHVAGDLLENTYHVGRSFRVEATSCYFDILSCRAFHRYSEAQNNTSSLGVLRVAWDGWLSNMDGSRYVPRHGVPNVRIEQQGDFEPSRLPFGGAD
jgi:hypothetical protein